MNAGKVPTKGETFAFTKATSIVVGAEGDIDSSFSDELKAKISSKTWRKAFHEAIISRFPFLIARFVSLVPENGPIIGHMAISADFSLCALSANGLTPAEVLYVAQLVKSPPSSSSSSSKGNSSTTTGT